MIQRNALRLRDRYINCNISDLVFFLDPELNEKIYFVFNVPRYLFYLLLIIKIHEKCWFCQFFLSFSGDARPGDLNE